MKNAIYLFKSLALMLVMLLTAQLATAQDQACATRDGRVKWLKDYQQNPGNYPESGDMLYVAMTIHIVGMNNGEGYIKENEVLRAFCELNEDFIPSDIQFYIAGDFNYIDNSNYYQHNWQQGGQMMNNHRVENTINVYFVDDPAGACGYSSYNNGIALSNNCVGPLSSTWAHEVGHYLSLPHTFSGWEGSNLSYSNPAPNQIDGHPVERADGSNCASSGDGFCDTPADYLNYRWQCDNNGMSLTSQIDPTGVEFHSDGTYYMSYSNDGCADQFSPDQISAMRANVLDEKADHLWLDAPIQPVDFDAFTVISPTLGSLVDDYYNVDFSWEPIPNATHYYLELSPLPAMQFVLYRYDLGNNTSYSTNQLVDNTTWYWRVQAYNEWHTCKEYTEIQSFNTGALSGLRDLEEVSSLAIRPNPVIAGEQISVSLHLQTSLQAEATLINLSGQTVYRSQWDLLAGQAEQNFSVAGIAPGIYFFRLQSANGVLTRKLVVGK